MEAKWRKELAIRDAVRALEHLVVTPLTASSVREHWVEAGKLLGYAQGQCTLAVKEIDAAAERSRAAVTAAAKAKADTAAAASARAAAFIAAHTGP